MRYESNRTSPLLALLLTVSPLANAQSLSLDEKIKAATVDMPITTAPATFLLGASGEEVPRVSTFRAFSSQAARAFDAKGKVANAIAVEIAPSLAMGKTTWEDIARSQFNRILSRTTLSFATKVGGDNGAKKSAVGLQAILYSREMDAAIIRAGSAECTGVAKGVDTTLPTTPNAPPVQISDALLAGIEKCQIGIDALLTKWNQTTVALGGGRVFASSEDTAAPPANDSSAYWLTASYGGDFANTKLDTAITRNGYAVTAHIRRTSSVAATAIDGSDTSARERIVGLNGRVGSAKLAGLIEYSQASYSGSGFSFDKRKRSVLGLEYKIDTDMYLTLGVARDTGADAKNQSLLAKFNWGMSKTPVIFK